MNRRLRQILLIAGLLALLPAGIALTELVSSVLRHGYGDRCFGRFYGFLAGRMGGEESHFFIRFEAQTESRWRWVHPKNYAYQSIDFEWRNGKAEGQALLDLRSGSITTESGSTALSETSLAALLGTNPDPDYKPTQGEIASVHSFLVAAAQGALPPPRHHPHNLDLPLAGSFVHFATGRHYPRAHLAWCFIWLVTTITFLVTARKWM